MSLKHDLIEVAMRDLKSTIKQESKYRDNKINMSDSEIYIMAEKAVNEFMPEAVRAIRDAESF